MINYNAILHLDSKDPDMLRLVARNAHNYLNALPGERFELVIVANGGGATLFNDSHEELRDIVNELLARHVKIKICANALAEHGIPQDKVWKGCHIAPAGLVEIVALQRRGFAYIKP